MAYVYTTPLTPYGNLTINAGYATTATGTSASKYTLNGSNYPTSIGASGRLDLNGTNADVVINGTSLKKTLDELATRLGWMVPNPQLEKEFEELQKLGEAYKQLEAECKEKMRVWNTLKDSNLD